MTNVRQTDTGTEQVAGKPTRPIDVLRKRHGGMTAEMKEFYKEQVRVKKLIREVLGHGPKTIPDLATITGLESPVCVWHLMAMRKYGNVVEGPLAGDYCTYRLKEGQS